MSAKSNLVTLILLACSTCVSGLVQVVHDRSFQPDYVLRVTSESVSVACRKKDTLIVNGM